jgi:predicted ribonuclease YlaK
MAKTYIFDTNVLIDDCNSIYRFEDSLIIIPMIVLEELDHLKKKDGKTGESARRANRELEKIRKMAIEQETSLAKGVYVESCNTRIKVWAEGSEMLPSMSKDSNDNKIIMVAYEFSKRYKKKYPNREVVLISNDINVRVKADSINVKCEKYNTDEITDVLYGGVAQDVQLPKSRIDLLFKTGFIEIEDLFCQFGYEHVLETMHINQYGCIKSVELNGGSALVKYTQKMSGEWIASLINKESAFDIKGRNREQRYALDALMDPNIQLVTLVGIPGSGKTLLAMAAALEQSSFSLFSSSSKKSGGRRAKGGRKKRVLNYQDEDFFMEDMDYASQKYGIAEGAYEKIVFTKPVVSVGKEIGFMPGPQPLDAKILTPSGWTTMGEIKQGDFVIGRDGKPKKVTKLLPQGKKEIFEVKTSDGRTTRCCGDHLWFTQTLRDRKNFMEPNCKKENWLGSVKSTLEIKETLRNYSKKYKGRLNHFLPRVSPVEFDNQKSTLPIPAYTLGVLLGDGSFSNSVSFASVDEEIISKVNSQLNELGYTTSNIEGSIKYNIISSKGLYNNKPARKVFLKYDNGHYEEYNSIGMLCKYKTDINRSTLQTRCRSGSEIDGIKYGFKDSPVNKWSNKIKNSIYLLGLEGTKSNTKFIPDQYMKATVQDRLELLRGLMDTDGTCKKNGEAVFYTSSPNLRDGVIELVRSLGGSATFYTRDRRDKESSIDNRKIKTKLLSHVVSISLPENLNPFYLSRKASRFKSKYSKGIRIQSIEPCGEAEVQCITVDSEDHLYVTDDYIITHNSLQEKMDPWLQPIWDNLDVLFRSPDMVEQFKLNDCVEISAMSHIRGRSIANSFIVIDEAQNMDKHEIKTVLTRVAQGSKIVLTGDVGQIDSRNLDKFSNGLSIVLEKFKDKPYASHITLKEGQRIQLASDASQLLD